MLTCPKSNENHDRPVASVGIAAKKSGPFGVAPSFGSITSMPRADALPQKGGQVSSQTSGHYAAATTAG